MCVSKHVPVATVSQTLPTLQHHAFSHTHQLEANALLIRGPRRFARMDIYEAEHVYVCEDREFDRVGKISLSVVHLNNL